MARIQTLLQADTFTAIMAFERLEGTFKSLLEGAAKDTEAGRFSIIVYDPVHEITIREGQFFLDEEEIETEDPLATVEDIVLTKENEDEELPFEAGAVGYVSFDVAAYYEKVGKAPKDELDLPDSHFFLYESYAIFDHQQETLTLVEENVYSKRSKEEMAEKLALRRAKFYDAQPLSTQVSVGKMQFTSNYSKADFMEKVQKAKQFIQQGDFFQVVLSQRLKADFHADPFVYYRKLRLLNPSPYLFYMDFGETKLIGSSPESLISVKNRIVKTNPIAGTRRRGQTKEEDQALAKELQTDEKELAEHKMLVDLGRNDIGKISRIGSVQVPVYLTIERYRFLMHLVSVVSGELREDVRPLEALKATLPAGTVSGAPKIRAIERIYEWENVKRGPYGGAAGYLTRRGNMDFALILRTMILKGKTAYVQAGAGIVYDSDPEKEYEETLQKAKALLEVGK
ncbi:anthranilate synthase component I [Listeria costaricensis]|uniref:anthranilate synthase component I n=1 Tax=Listeria costaricensis TaxID=2026604 RepID=UPI000C075BA3|nr:anthranilate synthase component I [Listeria costaricensis]